MGLLDLKPNTANRSLAGLSMLCYSEPGAGKTTFFADFKVGEKPTLILATEIGYKAIPGVIAQPVNSWNQAQSILRELGQKAVQEKFGAVAIDTLPNLLSLLEKAVLKIYNDKEELEASKKRTEPTTFKFIGDIPYGRGTAAVGKMLNDYLTAITQLGYALLIADHAEVQVETIGNKEISRFKPSVDKRAALVAKRMTDIVCFCEISGNDRIMHTKATNEYFAKSRVQLPDPLPFNFADFKEAYEDGEDVPVENISITDDVPSIEMIKEEINQEVAKLKGQGMPVEEIATLVQGKMPTGKKISGLTDEDYSTALDILDLLRGVKYEIQS